MSINLGRSSLTWETYYEFTKKMAKKGQPPPLMRKLRFPFGDGETESEQRVQNSLGYYLLTTLIFNDLTEAAGEEFQISIEVGDRNVTKGFVVASSVMSARIGAVFIPDWEHPIVIEPGDLITLALNGATGDVGGNGGIVASGMYVPPEWVPPNFEYRETTWTQLSFPVGLGRLTRDVTIPFNGFLYNVYNGNLGNVQFAADNRFSFFINDNTRPLNDQVLAGEDIGTRLNPNGQIYIPIRANDRIVVQTERPTVDDAMTFVFRLGKPWGISE